MNFVWRHKKNHLSSMLLASLMTITASAQASFYNKALGTKPARLLENRLSIKAPSTSSRDEINININSEKNLFKDQTILEYAHNGKRLRVVATELFVWRTENLQGNLATLLHGYPQKIGLKYKITQLDRNRYELIPSKLVLVKGMALVRTLFFVNRDNTLQSIDVYMDAAAIKHTEKSVALATKLLATVKPGKRKLRKGPRTIKLGSTKKPYQFKIRLPKGYVISSKQQNDARVHIIRKLVPLGRTQTSLAIYVGPKPSPYREHFGEYNTSNAAAYGLLLGHRINWRNLKKASKLKRRMVRASQQLAWTDKNKHSHQHYIHVFANAESSKGMKRLVSLAGKLRYVNKPRNRYVAINSGNYYNNGPAFNADPYDNNYQYRQGNNRRLFNDDNRQTYSGNRDRDYQDNYQDGHRAERYSNNRDQGYSERYNNERRNYDRHNNDSYDQGNQDNYDNHNPDYYE